MRCLAFALLAVALWGCDSAAGPAGPLVEGTWGGVNAGLIATDTSAHVHIGCTVGDTKSAILAGPDGRFDVSGLYNVSAFPISRGPDHPARFSGRISGRIMTLTVTLTDTAASVGPVQLIYGRAPEMGPCPICRVPKARPRP